MKPLKIKRIREEMKLKRIEAQLFVMQCFLERLKFLKKKIYLNYYQKKKKIIGHKNIIVLTLETWKQEK